MSSGIEGWTTVPSCTLSGIDGSATFKTFEQAFRWIVNGSTINGVHFQHSWYSDWSWLARKNLGGKFFEAMEAELNYDCIREVIKNIDLLQLFYFAHINETFKLLAIEKLSRLRIFPSTVGSINLMNFRYMLEMIREFKEISVSLKAFASPFGTHFDRTKMHILELIYTCTTGNILENVNLFDFDLNYWETDNIDSIVKLFRQRGIKVTFK